LGYPDEPKASCKMEFSRATEHTEKDMVSQSLCSLWALWLDFLAIFGSSSPVVETFLRLKPDEVSDGGDEFDGSVATG
jgi:hypothetical protein